MPVNIIPEESSGPTIAVDDEGIVHVACYLLTASNHEILYTTKRESNDWSTPINLSNGSGANPAITLDAQNLLHIVWSNSDHIAYRGPEIAEQSGDSTVSQTITVPITLSTPTLSFFYELSRAFAPNNTWFRVQVDNGLATTTIFSTTTNTDNWTHHWSDLTPWAGQTITLTFTVHETADRPYAWAYLDEVTVGSAYPDVWVNKQSRTPAALPGQQIAFTLTYGNGGGALASGVRLTDTLPAELTFVAASPPPLTTTPALVWDVGDLPAKSDSFTLVVTATVSPETPMMSYVANTASIGTASPELETANNSIQAWGFVGRRVYLPLISHDF
jgi:uncharacterized repeat protein (TIGR01451 family)